MLDVIAGLSLKNLKPPVWKKGTAYYLPKVRGVMVSYADFHGMMHQRLLAMQLGLHRWLGVPRQVKVYLDNGSFAFLRRQQEFPFTDYEEFVRSAKPDWYPIPRDFIPTPMMKQAEQRHCFDRTMAINRAFDHGAYVPVLHVSGFLTHYANAIKSHRKLHAKPALALGGIVPNLLKTPRSMALGEVVRHLQFVRAEFKTKQLHVFGIGGTATLHIAGLLGMDSVDSSGWRNRAARGIIQLPGSGDRMIANLGSWRGRKPNRSEMRTLQECPCPACQLSGLRGLKALGIEGFSNRACHNLWILLEESRWIREKLASKEYAPLFKKRLDNSIYLPLIEYLVETLAVKQTRD